MGAWLATGTHRSTVGAVVDMTFGVFLIIFGIIGFYGTLKTNEFWIRVFYYWSISVIFLAIALCSWAVYEFIIQEIWYMVYIMISDMIWSTIIWSYIAYKVNRFYNLVFAHYQQLSDGVEEEAKKQNNNNDGGDDDTVTV